MRVAIAPLPRRLVPLGPARRVGLRYGTKCAPGDTEILAGGWLFLRRRLVLSASRPDGVGVGGDVRDDGDGDGDGDGDDGASWLSLSAVLKLDDEESLTALLSLDDGEGLTVMFSLPANVGEEKDESEL